MSYIILSPDICMYFCIKLFIMEVKNKIDFNRTYIYDKQPFLLYWELTRSCDLACKHCRAEAIFKRDPQELDTKECYAVIDEIKRFGNPSPHIVLTGGDPLNREDLFDIICYLRNQDINFSLAPSATNKLSRKVLNDLKELNVQTMSLSIDGSNSKSHDEFRQVEGCFEDTLEAAKNIKDFNIPLQINTLVCRNTIDELEGIYKLAEKLEILRWSVFFLIQVGRGAKLESITPAQADDVMSWLYEKSLRAPFAIKTTEAPHFRRIAIEQFVKTEEDNNSEYFNNIKRGFGIRDGNGIMFISHTGAVYPSGFLPKVAGNVKTESPVDIYRRSKIFNEIRDPSLFKGKCGYCEYSQICGGSRARAFGWTGDYLSSDPLCLYKPVKN